MYHASHLLRPPIHICSTSPPRSNPNTIRNKSVGLVDRAFRVLIEIPEPRLKVLTVDDFRGSTRQDGLSCTECPSPERVSTHLPSPSLAFSKIHFEPRSQRSFISSMVPLDPGVLHMPSTRVPTSRTARCRSFTDRLSWNAEVGESLFCSSIVRLRSSLGDSSGPGKTYNRCYLTCVG